MKCVGWGIFVLPVLLSAQMSISTTEKVSQELTPDVLQGNLGFEEISTNPEPIKRDLNAIVAEVKRFDPKGRLCRGGGYRLSPRYGYKNQKQEFLGYTGSLGFGCEFETIDQYNALSEAIDRVMGSGVRKTQTPLSWQVSLPKQESSRLELRSAMLRKVRMQAERFSHELQMVCEAVTVQMGHSPAAVPMRVRTMAMMESVPTESPILSDEESLLEAEVIYTCMNH